MTLTIPSRFLGGINAVMYYPNPCQLSYPIMYQSYAMEAQADATCCCIIVLLLVQFSLEEEGVIKVNMRVLPLPILALP